LAPVSHSAYNFTRQNEEYIVPAYSKHKNIAKICAPAGLFPEKNLTAIFIVHLNYGNAFNNFTNLSDSLEA